MSRKGGYQILNFGKWNYNFIPATDAQEPQPANLCLCSGIADIIENCIKKTDKRIIISGLVVNGILYRDFEVQRRIVSTLDNVYELTGAGVIITCFTEGGRTEWGNDFEKVYIAKGLPRSTTSLSSDITIMLQKIGVFYDVAEKGHSGGN